MPLYKMIGLISERHALMLDIEWYKTKCGYALEVIPRPQAEYRVTEIEIFVKQFVLLVALLF